MRWRSVNRPRAGVSAGSTQGSEFEEVAPETGRHLGNLHKITRGLQELASSLRMVPLRATFQRMARLARDLARKAGKPIDFGTAGEETELDKTVVERIGDPLVHLIRNAVDHGLEPTVEARQRVGKADAGRLVASRGS